jgi:hypothetical protein
MVIVHLFTSLIGTVSTAVWFWNDSAILALALAPLGGAAAVLSVAIVITHWRIRNIGRDKPEPESVYLRRSV